MTTTAKKNPGRFLLLGLKSTKLIKLFKVFKLLKVVKPFLTFGTMALSILVYAFAFGSWVFAAGFVVMLFIHEMGHVFVLKKRGYDASSPVFIPMLGAAIFTPSLNTASDEASVGYGGPLLGSSAAIAAFLLWWAMPSHPVMLLLIAHTAFFLNLFNLIPIRPLDGGRITQAVGGWVKYFGVAALITLSLLIREPQLLLIWIICLEDLPFTRWQRFFVGATCQLTMMYLMATGQGHQPAWANWLDVFLATCLNLMLWSVAKNILGQPQERKYPPLPMKSRLKWFAVYATTAVSLVTLMHFTGQYLPHK